MQRMWPLPPPACFATWVRIIYPGPDIEIPTGLHEKRTTPEDTHAASSAALQAGADGVIYARKYSEMRLANLDAAGQAVRAFKGG